ncbi:MAG: recombinase family protein [Planctomycetota bacterium]|nr:recombinase family protein [Planctomycetota bacterium]
MSKREFARKSRSEKKKDASPSSASEVVVPHENPSPVGQLWSNSGSEVWTGKPTPLRVIIYTRFSSSMQRPESCTNQERAVRAALDQKGIDHSQAEVIRDEAISGTKETREGYARILEAVRRKERLIVAVDDQSRLSRNDMAKLIIKRIIFHGGRFISASDNIDTDQKGWELSVGFRELQNTQFINSLAEKVYNNQAGRILDENGSAGDLCFGYRSRLKNGAAPQYSGRGSKPEKVVYVYVPEARWVIRIFEWFDQGRSASWIAKELNRLNVPKPPGSTKKGWYTQLIRRILGSSKYAGVWTWGKTRTRRDGEGNKMQVPVAPGDEITVLRPKLRIVRQALWERVQAKLELARQTYGSKPGQKRRGPKVHHSALYPSHVLGGLLFCGACGARLHREYSKPRHYYACPTHRKKGQCEMSYRVPEERAQDEILKFLSNYLQAIPGWFDHLYAQVCTATNLRAQEIPRALEAQKEEMATIEKQLQNYLDVLGQGAGQSVTIANKMVDLEQKAEQARKEIAFLEKELETPAVLPDLEAVRRMVADLHVVLGQDEVPQVALLLQKLLGKVKVRDVVAPGKKRGYGLLEFCICPEGLLKEALKKVVGARDVLLKVTEVGPMPVIILEIGGPTRMDSWAPKIAEMRARGVSWKEIGEETGLGVGNACTAYKRYIEGLKKPDHVDNDD